MTNPTDQANAERIEIPSKIVEAERWTWKGNTLVASGFSLVLENEQTAKYVAESHNSTLPVMADRAAVEAYRQLRVLTPDPSTKKEIEGLVDTFGEAAQIWGWEADQGTGDAPEKAHAVFVEARAALLAKIAKIAAALARQRVPEELRKALSFIPEGELWVNGDTADVYVDRGMFKLKIARCAVGDNWQRYAVAVAGSINFVRSLIPAAPAIADGGWEPPIAAHDVLAERRRQVEQEGWTAEHDDGHSERELAKAAGCYALSREWNACPPFMWPFDDSWWKQSGDPRRDLVKAGALILAEIERLDRTAPPQQQHAATGER